MNANTNTTATAKHNNPRMNFEAFGLATGTVLTLKSNPEVTCEVASAKTVKIGEQELSLHKATQVALGKTFVNHLGRKWMVDGETSLEALYCETFNREMPKAKTKVAEVNVVEEEEEEEEEVVVVEE